MEPFVLRGRVTSGKGDLAQWMALYSDVYLRKTGVRLFPGSLNVVLDEPWSMPRAGVTRIEADDYPEEIDRKVPLSLLPCQVFGRRGFVLRTDRNEADADPTERLVIEVLSEVKLRDTHALCDGDVIEIVVSP